MIKSISDHEEVYSKHIKYVQIYSDCKLFYFYYRHRTRYLSDHQNSLKKYRLYLLMAHYFNFFSFNQLS
jgi:hypothetical protein